MFSETLAWRAVLALDQLIRQGGQSTGRFVVDAQGARIADDQAGCTDQHAAQGAIEVWSGPSTATANAPERDADNNQRLWRTSQPVDERVARLLDLYLPIVLAPVNGRPQVIAHLAQSLDGRIATASGSSQWISGALDLVHNHRMRALCDAILVGAETVIHDDPQLTCRGVEGPHPMRVVVDPKRRVGLDRRIFTDASVPTILITHVAADNATAADNTAADSPTLPPHVTWIALGESEARIAPEAILSALWSQGIRRLFVEGGGVTVSGFLHAGLLDRLQLTVAPMVIGSGRAGIQLPVIDSLDHALRPHIRRFRLDPDMLFECVFHE